MREAIGGSLLYFIVIPLIFLFVIFIAFIMNYASAYRASNYVISQIETCDANLSSSGSCSHSDMDSIKTYIRTKYHYSHNIDSKNFCYIENSKGTVYRVTLNVYFDLPLIGAVGVYNVVSESKTIYNVHEGADGTFGNGIKPCN